MPIAVPGDESVVLIKNKTLFPCEIISPLGKTGLSNFVRVLQRKEKGAEMKIMDILYFEKTP